VCCILPKRVLTPFYFLLLQEGKQASVENVNRLNQVNKDGDGAAEALRRGFTREESTHQLSNMMQDAAATAFSQVAQSATANVAFSSVDTKVIIDIGGAVGNFQKAMAKSIGRVFHPGSGHNALLDSQREAVGKPSTKIRLVDNTMADTREVTSSASRQALNSLATTENDQVFVASDAATLLSLHPEVGLLAAAVTPAEGMLWSSSDALGPIYPQSNAGRSEQLYDQMLKETFAESTVVCIENVDTGENEEQINPTAWKMYTWLTEERELVLNVIEQSVSFFPDLTVEGAIVIRNRIKDI
jgi:hypothetical protein